MNPKVSLIVAVYGLNYLDECLNSVSEQNYSNLEVIIVDDKSPDTAPSFCDEFATKKSIETNQSWKVIHNQENLGVDKSRTVGIEAATGEFVAFVDGDDYLEPDYISAMVNAVSKSTENNESFDVAFCAKFDDFKNESEINPNYPPQTFQTRRELFDFFFGLNRPTEFPSGWQRTIWCTLFKKSALSTHYSFDRSLFWGDTVACAQALTNCQNGILIPDANYHWRQRKSADSKINGEKSNLEKLERLEKVLLKIAAETNVYSIFKLLELKLKAWRYFQICKQRLKTVNEEQPTKPTDKGELFD